MNGIPHMLIFDASSQQVALEAEQSTFRTRLVLVTERAQAVRASFLEVNELLSGLQRVVELGKTRDLVNSTYTSAGKQLEKLHLKAKIAELELQHADDVEEKAAARQVWPATPLLHLL